jgi:hypothetical protein
MNNEDEGRNFCKTNLSFHIGKQGEVRGLIMAKVLKSNVS